MMPVRLACWNEAGELIGVPYLTCEEPQQFQRVRWWANGIMLSTYGKLIVDGRWIGNGRWRPIVRKISAITKITNPVITNVIKTRYWR